MASLIEVHQNVLTYLKILVLPNLILETALENVKRKEATSAFSNVWVYREGRGWGRNQSYAYELWKVYINHYHNFPYGFDCKVVGFCE